MSRTPTTALAVVLLACSPPSSDRVARPSSQALSPTSASSGPTSASSTSTVSPSPTPPPRAAGCPPLEESQVTGTIEDPELDEISGIVAGRRSPGVLWAEEDSGNAPAISALDPSGELVSTIAVDGATNRDWEDLAWGIGRLWIADIGDNARERPQIRVYSFREPKTIDATSVDADVLRLRYEDGSHDAEAMNVDARDRTLYIVIKQATQPTSDLYAFPLADAHRGGVGVLRRVGAVALPVVTAADNGPAGIVIRNYLWTLVYPWAPDRSVVSTLQAAPCPVSLGSSEAVAQLPDGSGVYSIPEGVGASVRFATL